MKITISRIVKIHTEKTLVEFSTLYGEGLSSLFTLEARENRPYDVEINIDDDFYWGKNIFTSMSNTPSIRHEAETTYITAELISITEDGCGSLRLGNSIIFISLKNDNKDLIFPSFVEILAIQITLYPTNI
ncbi:MULTISPECIES: hypothetical protein [Pseudomonas]|uniref:Uncharacterized protein n=1 Tax=Pseudomonas aphyarum TaxID=2942629 RepID=A0ABT5PPA4_9PSED|nr:hypothetical protein [Pseudomonas aphyarum]MDD0971477.1 hypothetical protein [Pseudomonas aphyarum]MDD1125371.1 hypothetical protein [Pseudomonas aphyarum]